MQHRHRNRHRHRLGSHAILFSQAAERRRHSSKLAVQYSPCTQQEFLAALPLKLGASLPGLSTRPPLVATAAGAPIKLALCTL